MELKTTIQTWIAERVKALLADPEWLAKANPYADRLGNPNDPPWYRNRTTEKKVSDTAYLEWMANSQANLESSALHGTEYAQPASIFAG